MTPFVPGQGSRVRAVQAVREIAHGETGTVEAAWTRALVAVRWDRDGAIRRIHRKRLESAGDPVADGPEPPTAFRVIPVTDVDAILAKAAAR